MKNVCLVLAGVLAGCATSASPQKGEASSRSDGLRSEKVGERSNQIANPDDIVAIEQDSDILNSLFEDTIKPVEHVMCHAATVPKETCSDLCTTSEEINTISLRICRHVRQQDGTGRFARCVDSQDLAKRARTVCSYLCKGEALRRPCPNVL